jgi:thioredoxin 1
MIVALHFWSPTCNPCKVIKPAIEDLKEEFGDKIHWISVNTHADNEGYATHFQVSVVPTIVFLKDDKEIGRHSGTQMAVYYSLIRRALAA